MVSSDGGPDEQGVERLEGGIPGDHGIVNENHPDLTVHNWSREVLDIEVVIEKTGTDGADEVVRLRETLGAGIGGDDDSLTDTVEIDLPGMEESIGSFEIVVSVEGNELERQEVEVHDGIGDMSTIHVAVQASDVVQIGEGVA